MRTVTLQMNYRIDTEMNLSIKTEVLVDNDNQAEQAGEEAARFVMRMINGMTQGFASPSPTDD